MATPAAYQFETVVAEKFPGTRFGRRNCRRIANRQTYSQHSWDNARDVYPPLSIPYSGGPGNPGYTLYKLYLDEVVDFVRANLDELNVRGRGLWQVADHWNHAHFDFLPYGYLTPKCAGGIDRYKYPDGTVSTTATLINTYEEEQLMNMVAFVNAAYDSGNPNLSEPDRQYWLNLAMTKPTDPEFYYLFKAALSPVDGKLVQLKPV